MQKETPQTRQLKVAEICDQGLQQTKNTVMNVI
jgi:hypothetical protein